ncbi:hypothetical protein ID866_2512 [Astraeus odoratus]|nr:hypothetical protein ID866_2512 [Astraeus odoratus]
MHRAWFLRHRCRLLMQTDPSKQTASAHGPTLKRPFSQRTAASALKPASHAEKVPPMQQRTPCSVGDQRPGKIPKLGTDQSPSSPPSKLRSERLKVVSPPFTIPASSKSKESPVPSRKLGRGKGKGKGQSRYDSLPEFEGPMHDAVYIEAQHRANIGHRPEIKPALADNPKSPLMNFVLANLGSDNPLPFEFREYFDSNTNRPIIRCTLELGTEPQIIAIGDHADKKAAERLCCLSALYQLYDNGLLDKPAKPPAAAQPAPPEQITLPDGSFVNYERARSFMDYYCRLYNFGKPDIDYQHHAKKGQTAVWEAIMTVGGRRIGMGTGSNKKAALVQCYLDVTQYLENCDPELWKKYVEAAKSGKDLGLAPKVYLQISSGLGDEVEDLCREIKKSVLYKNRPNVGSKLTGSDVPTPNSSVAANPKPSYPRYYPPHIVRQKADLLKQRRDRYLADPGMEKMRSTRAALPIFTKSKELLDHIKQNEVTICMAATGSGKTTQIPQIILDDHIDRGEGSQCNIICTQPRRLAALSVADRVAKERGEVVGQGSVGYNIRFESKLPEEHGSITFCTIGVLLRRMQSAMTEGGKAAARLDEITHIVVDEVHERDVDTDLLLVVLKRLLVDRRERNIPLKVVLMSATIDPTLFQEYFPDENGRKAPVIDIPGRTFPVKKQFLEDFIQDIKRQPQLDWVFNEESVSRYLAREEAYAQSHSTSTVSPTSPTSPSLQLADDELDMPSPLVAATICHVLQQSDSGHVLVFLPGWEDIMVVQRILQESQMPLNFNDTKRFSVHLLHSTVPLADQQVIFEPPPEGVRRIILATNIAETSVTIPDVVYVVDTAKIKEIRYDPNRHMSSLICAWVGSSNLHQRAGRAGRHRPGEYYGLLSRVRATTLNPHQTVEMKRVDLSNVVMHVKALSFPDMEVEDVLAETIEPPDPDRVAAAMKDLQMVGALDYRKNLTSLGRVLLQLPVEVQMGRLVLYGTFFRCVDQAVTLAAILTNRDPFVSPMHLKAEAAAAKAKWSPVEFRSDALTILNAYNAWHEIYATGNHSQANRFCNENFLSKPTLLLIRKIRYHLLQSLYQAGVFDVTESGGSYGRGRDPEIPAALNVNGNSSPLLAALIAVASQPKYAVRTGEKTLRTQHDKTTFIHPSSVNHRKHVRPAMDQAFQGEKQLFAFAEKRQNLTVVGQTPQTYLINTTRLDPMTYLLFGASDIQVTERGLECDGWLPVVGNLDVLDDIQRLKTLMESCMLRVYEAVLMNQRRRRGQARPETVLAREEDETGDDSLSLTDLTMSSRETADLDMITRDIVRILDRFSEERLASQSQQTSRTATPMASPAFSSSRLPNLGSRPGYASPYGVGSAYNSRPGTPTSCARMAANMRGLTQVCYLPTSPESLADAMQFIADIRGARVRELEEKRINKEMANIRKKFKGAVLLLPFALMMSSCIPDGNLDGYQKKKYVAKIIFTYILGYKVDIGHLEAVNLISSSKYSEKQIGYLAVTLLMHENSDFLRLVVNSIRKDLDENNEVHNCLALHAIANVGSSEMAEALAEDVHRLLISPTSMTFVKKKAALTLLRLYRKRPEIIPAAEWALRLVSLMDDQDLGVVLCVTSLVMALAQDHPDAYAVCYTKAVDRLYRLVMEHEYSATYAYYKVPAPWLQVKLLRLLQYYPPTDDATIKNTLVEVLRTIMASSAEPSRNVQHNNAQHSVLFEAISLAIHLDASSPLVDTAAVLLARFISSKETNVRYLGLDTMAHLAARVETLDPLKKHQGTIILSLRDKDISVRRRALDLLYSMCDVDNSELIVGELLRYLKVADYVLREEMVLKIAILTEKYASSYKWYVDTILQLISAAGDHVGEEVWYRVVQIVTNTEDLQEYAARVVFEYLKTPSAHESLVKVGGYILGEYGHLIANESGYSPIEQFQVLHSKSQFCVASTRSLLLSTYIKWVNVFPEIKQQLINIFERYRHVLDAELQQRACEYYALASRPDDEEMLQNVCEEMPPFPPRVSGLTSRLNRKLADTEDKRTWIHGGRELNLEQQITTRKPSRAADPTEDNTTAASKTVNSSILDSLSGLDLSASNTTREGEAAPRLTVGPSIDKWYRKLIYSAEGVLYEDVQIQIGIKSRYQGYLGQLAIYFGNKVSVPLTSFTSTIYVSEPESLSATFAKIPANVLAPRTQSQQLLHVECKKAFTTPPVLTVSFLAGAHQSVSIRLPIAITKFFEGVKFGQADFFERWKLIGGPPRECQVVFPISLDSVGHLDLPHNRRIILGNHFEILEGIDPNPSNIVGAAVLHTSVDGKVGCLLRLEPNREAKLCRLTVRSTSEDVAAEVRKLVEAAFKADL